jgi:DNA-binding YbaB/EbfC family protein
MFKEIGQLASLMKNAGKIREEMEKLQQRLGQLTAEGDAGGGMVKISVNGNQEIVSCKISDECMKLNDREMLEDLVRAATNQALERARQLAAQETGKMATGLGLPPGMGLPGLGS